ncbi:hypothetical protein NCCP691_05850 [Noviherbaspirillum aridicola]|uniref:DUF6531 domain-containing protein n=2 Tax=Noviherbaspirillum aridicola TaxID=2849687 RepID=A0ABQ4Q0L6_9BURK|nr:hypothetical protein NCCP691_05850 [Noviherbaspirillum aridicola]
MQCGPASTGATCDAPAVAARQSGTGIVTGGGNPINIITGNKYQREVDMPALPGVLGLELVRHYNSGFSRPADANGIIGRGWRLSYETDLFVRGNSLHILQADGSRLIFHRDPKDPGTCASDDPSRGKITIRDTPEGPEYTWHWPEGRQLLFNPQGRLVQILAPTGEFVSLQRALNGDLLKVTDPQGRSLQLRYLDRQAAARNDRYQGVVAIDTPVGEFRYEYGNQAPRGSDIHPDRLLATLVRVHLPASYDHDRKRHAWTERGTTTSTVTRHYHHEDPRHPTLLTGISVSGTGSDGRAMQERVSTYAYDAAGKGILSVRGEPLRHDAQGKPVPGTGVGQVGFDRSQPGVTRLTNSLGQVTVFRHAIIGGEYRMLEVRGPGCDGCGETNVRYGYDRLGRVTETTRLNDEGLPLETTRIERDALGRHIRVARLRHSDGKPGKPDILASYDYPRVSERQNEPSSISRPSVVPGKQHTTRISYNASGQPVRIEETGWSPGAGGTQARPIARGTSIEYIRINGRSLPVALRQDGETGERIRIEYDARGSYPVKIMTADGDSTEILDRAVDGRARRLRVRDGERSTLVAIDYLASGQIKSITRTADSPGQNAAERRLGAQYDALARLTELRLPAQVLRMLPGGDSATAQPPAQLAASREPMAERLVFGTGEAGSAAEREVTEIALHGPAGAEPVGKRWLDDFGRLVALEYRGQGISRASYDGGSERLKAVTDGAGIETRLYYDQHGKPRLLERRDRTGQVLERIEYKHSGRLLAEQARYGADNKGRPDSLIRRTYNAFGQVTDEYQQSGEFAYTVHHRYDSEGRVAKTWLSEHTAGAVQALPPIRFRYSSDDGGNHPEAITAESGWMGSRQVASEIKWLAPVHSNGQDLSPDRIASVAAGWRFGNGLVARSEYQQNKAPALPWTLLAHHDGIHAHAITSDATGRILAASRQARELRGTRAGTPSSPSTASGTPAIPTATSKTALPPSPAAVEAEFDPAGRRRTYRHNAQDYELTWSAAGELAALRDRDQPIATYLYDAEGRRIAKTVTGQPAASRRFIYSGKRLIAEADGAGKIIRQYIHLGWRPIAWMEPARGVVERAREYITGPRLVYLHTDHRGAVTAATDDEKSILWSAQLDDRGNTSPAAGQGQTFEQPLRLVNQYADAESGLHYNLARYYDPATGAFLSPDPAGFDAGYLDLYSYANGDMLNLVDPDGWATITYYLIDTARDRNPKTPGQYRWAFWIRDIGIEPNLNILYDRDGSFVRTPNPLNERTSFERTYMTWNEEAVPRGPTVEQRFVDHYVNDMISPDSFSMHLDDRAALQILEDLQRHGDVVRKYYGCAGQPGAADTQFKLVLPPAKLRSVTLYPGGVAGQNDSPEGRIVDQGIDTLTCKQAMTPEEAFARLKTAIQIKESGGADCSKTGCPAATWNPSGTPASYGPTQFVVGTFVDRLLAFSKPKRRLKGSNLVQITLYELQSKMTKTEERTLGFADDSGGDTGLKDRLEKALSRAVHVTGGTLRGKKIVGWRDRLRPETPIEPADPIAVDQFAEETGFLHRHGSTTSEAYQMYTKIVKWHQLIEILRPIRRTAQGNPDEAHALIKNGQPGMYERYKRLQRDLGFQDRQLNAYIKNPIWNEGWQGFASAAVLTDKVLKEYLIGSPDALFKDKNRFDIVSDREIRWKYAQFRATHQADEELEIAMRLGYFHNTGNEAKNISEARSLNYAKHLGEIWSRESKNNPCGVKNINRFDLDPKRMR